MSALLLIVLLTWHRAAALSLFNVKPAASVPEEDSAISDGFIPQVKSPMSPKKLVTKSLAYQKPQLESKFSNIPEQEFILDNSAQPVKRATSLKKDLSRYLSNNLPIGDQTDDGLTLQKKNVMEATNQLNPVSEHLMQVIQRACSKYMTYLHESKPLDTEKVMDASIEMITYLCEEYQDSGVRQKSPKVVLDKKYISEARRRRSDLSRFYDNILRSEHCKCKKLDWPEDSLRSWAFRPSPVARSHRCHKHAPVARSHRCHKHAPVARSHRCHKHAPVARSHRCHKHAPVARSHRCHKHAPVARSHRSSKRSPVARSLLSTLFNRMNDGRN